MTGERLARYYTRVHASNRHAGYGEPVEVLAATRQEAVSRAIDLGWSARREDARVTVDKVIDETPQAPTLDDVDLLTFELIDDAFCDVYSEFPSDRGHERLGRVIGRLHAWREAHGLTYKPFGGAS